MKIDLYGNKAADIAACAVSSTMALTSSILRLVADRHYASDSIVGAAIGGGVGVGLPLLLHYGRPTTQQSSSGVSARWTVAPFAVPEARGVSLYGWF